MTGPVPGPPGPQVGRLAHELGDLLAAFAARIPPADRPPDAERPEPELADPGLADPGLAEPELADPGLAHGGAAGAGSPHAHRTPAECRVCPVCQAVRVLRTLRPDVVEHLEAATGEFVAALRALLDTGEPTASASTPARPTDGWAAAARPPAQHIDITD